jgi:hypothetical protein
MTFDNMTGEYTIVLIATMTAPFLGEFRINVNLFNPSAPATNSLFQDVLNDFNLSTGVAVIILSGTNLNLLAWDAGDVVATNTLAGLGNPPGSTFFRTSVTSVPFGFLTNEDAIAYGPAGSTVITPAVSRDGDFDGDSKADVVVFRPSDGGWWVWSSLYNVGYRLAGWGAPGDIPLAGDLDSDGQPDLIAYRPSTGYWFVLYSSNGYSTALSRSFQWGTAGDIPLLADFDGDGRPDLTIYRPSTGYWFVWFSSTGFVPGGWTSFPWGAAGDQPLAGDFDGDGKADLAVFRPSTGQWFVAFSSFSYSPSLLRAWGAAGDQPIVGDFDGDGKTDLTVFRPSTGVWFIWFSSGGYVSGNWGSFSWGQPGDQPAVNDYDGDGRTDIAVWRPSTGEWFILTSSTGFTSSLYRPWGAVGDIPLAK